MPRRYLAIWLKHWAAERWWRTRRHDASAKRPLVLVETVGPRRQVAAADPRALAQGVAPGMGLTDAQTLLPDLLTMPADPLGEQPLHIALAHRLIVPKWF